jgi:hypothetical protein
MNSLVATKTANLAKLKKTRSNSLPVPGINFCFGGFAFVNRYLH